MIRAWHSTDSLIAFPQRCIADEMRKSNDRHANGAWGLWCTLIERMAVDHPFGRNLYTFEIDVEDHLVIECSIDVITKLSRPGDEFTMRDIANKWRHCYKFLRIAEANGVCMQGVVLDYSAIKNWELQSSSK
jgi:hypothetical protein